MRKISHLMQKLAAIAAIGVYSVAAYFLNIPCIIKYATGVPCPGCGLTRAWMSALRGDFTAAFSYHAMFWSLPLLILYFFLDGRVICRGHADKVVAASLLGGFLANWFCNIF